MLNVFLRMFFSLLLFSQLAFAAAPSTATGAPAPGDGFFINGVYSILKGGDQQQALKDAIGAMKTKTIYIYPDFGSIYPAWQDHPKPPVPLPFKIDCKKNTSGKARKYRVDFFAPSLYQYNSDPSVVSSKCMAGADVVSELRAASSNQGKKPLIIPIISGSASILHGLNQNTQAQQTYLIPAIVKSINAIGADGVGFDLESPSFGDSIVAKDKPKPALQKSDAQFIINLVDQLNPKGSSSNKYVAVFDGEHIISELALIAPDKLKYIIILRAMYDMGSVSDALDPVSIANYAPKGSDNLDPVSIANYAPKVSAFKNNFDLPNLANLNVQFVAPASATDKIYNQLVSFNHLFIKYPKIADAFNKVFTAKIPPGLSCLQENNQLKDCFSSAGENIFPSSVTVLKDVKLLDSYPLLCWNYPLNVVSGALQPYSSSGCQGAVPATEFASLFNGKATFSVNGQPSLSNTQYYQHSTTIDPNIYAQYLTKAIKVMQTTVFSHLKPMGVVLYTLRPEGFYAMTCNKNLFTLYGDPEMSQLCLGLYPEHFLPEVLDTYKNTRDVSP
jgi:hypothetical protein